MITPEWFIAMAKPYTMLGNERIINIYEATKYVVDNKIDGDWIECGVWKGGVAFAAINLLTNMQSDKQIYLYDTFEGMTEPSDYDVDCYGNTAKSQGDSIKCMASFEDVNNLLSEISPYPIHIIKGDVRQTLQNEDNLPKNIAFLHLDTDFYDSTLIELQTLWSKLSSGGVCIIDDYGHWSGSKKAVDEFFNNFSHPEIKTYKKIDYTAIQLVKQ